MPDKDILDGLLRDMGSLTERLQRLESERIRFEVVNVNRVVLGTNQNNWDIPDVDKISIEASVAAITINGIANGVNGRVLFLENTKSGTTITLTHNSGSASAGNKILLPSGAGTLAFAAGRSALLIYSYQVGISDYAWRVIVYST